MVAMLAVLVVPFLTAHAQGRLDPSKLGVGQGSAFQNETLLGTKSLETTTASIINSILAILGIVAVVIIILGGFTWMTAAGDDTKLKRAKGFITSGIVGLAIILSAYAIATFVINKLIQAVN